MTETTDNRQILPTEDDLPIGGGLKPANKRERSRLPILVGVLGGMIGWIILAPFYEQIGVGIFGGIGGKRLWATPGFYCIHRTALLVLCTVGGGIGVTHSSMSTKHGILFLVAVLAVVAVFAAIFPR
jgi:hypothetical protein